MSAEVIKLNSLTVGYSVGAGRGKALLSGLDLSCRSGEITGLIGRNGTGKSTLLRTMAGLLRPLDGEILINNTRLTLLDRRTLARLIGFVSTEVPVIPSLKVIELVALGRYPYTDWTGRLTKTDRNIVHLSVEQVGIENITDKFISEISDGERQRAMIARALAQDTAILVLDEPTAFLDLPNRFEILRLLNQLAADSGKTVIFSTHDLSIALHESDKIWLLNNGKIVTGAPEDLIIKKEFFRLFDNSSLEFDDDKGEIRPKRNFRISAGLIARGHLKFWTAHAIERLGIESVKKDAALNITAEEVDGIAVWKVFFKNNEYKTHSVYELCLLLKSIINKKE